MKKEMNNKGFSLVELIIVIAIMVILIAVLAPQYLRYVEKSRVASDQNTIVEYINAMQTIAADPDISLTAPASGTASTYSVTIDSTGKINVSADLQTLLTNYGILDSTTIASSKVQSAAYKSSGGAYTLHYKAPDGAAAGVGKMWVVVPSGNVDISGAVTP
ncbi:MAG: type II secretion system GspH family protein [Lachnospiraceae bacterium]|nr:type II secretion system GspH family protein [Lachnospiraceae bacterium]